MFLHLCVCPQGVGLPQCRDTIPPGAETSRRADNPPGAGTSPRQQTVTAADGTHPTGMHSCYGKSFVGAPLRRVEARSYRESWIRPCIHVELFQSRNPIQFLPRLRKTFLSVNICIVENSESHDVSRKDMSKGWTLM